MSLVKNIKNKISEAIDKARASILKGLVPKSDNLKLEVAKALLGRDYGGFDPIPFWDHVDMTDHRIMNVATPIEAKDAVNKEYVDSIAKPSIMRSVIFGAYDTDWKIVTEPSDYVAAEQVTSYDSEIPFDVVVHFANPSGSGVTLYVKTTVLREDGVEDVVEDWISVPEGITSFREHLINRIFNVLSAGKKIKGVRIHAYYVGSYPVGKEPKVRLVTKTLEFNVETFA